MKPIEQRRAAAKFAKDWAKKKGVEKKETQKFWNDLLEKVYGVENVRDFIFYEDDVKVGGITKWIDACIPTTKVIIEQKSKGVDLDKKIRQSGGAELTPYEQAMRYANNQTNNKRPNWIVTCNFEEFHIHNLNNEDMEQYETVRVCDLEEEFGRMKFLQDIKATNTYKEVQVSRQAGELIGEIYDKLLEQYDDKPTEQQLHQLNILCVRLVFCLYAEDADIFDNNAFLNYLSEYPSNQLREKLLILFEVLNTPKEKRSPFLDERLKAFPWVNGGLFETGIDVPPITEEVRMLLLDRASRQFNWRNISPTIFGAMFESTLNPETRHDGGMHYTSIANIHKVIDPLFLDDLKTELDGILKIASEKKRKPQLVAFQQKLGRICCLDPACGSGNFLTETYMSLRELENRAIAARYNGRLNAGLLNPIEVNIRQFYGIEINDFAVAVAKTAMWIAEYQMWTKTMNLVARDDSGDDENGFLPLKSYNNIHLGNALRTEWNDIVKSEELTYIVGNPPFVGSNNKKKEDEQKREVCALYVDENGKKYHNSGKLDYVAGWYMKAAKMMKQNPSIKTVLVSTNSVTQGEQVASMWKPLMQDYGVRINFAWRTFVWDGKANVHCVIIGFGVGEQTCNPIIYDKENRIEAKHINPYLVDLENVWIENNKKQVSNAPRMCKGSQPTGDFDVSKEELDMIREKYPDILPYIKRYTGATEFISGKERYCFWLKDANPAIIRRCPWLMKRIEAIRKQRSQSTKAATRKKAETPALFDEDRQPDTDYLLVPRHTSERREYIPIGFMSKDVICGDANLLIADATPYHFGILTSRLHMIWAIIIGGKIKSDPRYSNDIVYNNFPWPEATESHRNQISELAQAVLDARATNSNCSLADLYDPDTMPSVLRKAHNKLDRAVLKLYNLNPDADEMDILKHLLGLYKEIIKKNK